MVFRRLLSPNVYGLLWTSSQIKIRQVFFLTAPERVLNHLLFSPFFVDSLHSRQSPSHFHRRCHCYSPRVLRVCASHQSQLTAHDHNSSCWYNGCYTTTAETNLRNYLFDNKSSFIWTQNDHLRNIALLLSLIWLVDGSWGGKRAIFTSMSNWRRRFLTQLLTGYDTILPLLPPEVSTSR